MATGQLPFFGITAAVIFDAVLNRPPAGLSRVHPKMRPVVSRAPRIRTPHAAIRQPPFFSRSSGTSNATAVRRHGPHGSHRHPDRSQPAEEQSGFARTWTHHLSPEGALGMAPAHGGEHHGGTRLLSTGDRQRSPTRARVCGHGGLLQPFGIRAVRDYGAGRRISPGESCRRAGARARSSLARRGASGPGAVQFLYDWDWSGAEADFRKSAESHSDGTSESQFNFGVLLAVLGRFEDAIAESRPGLRGESAFGRRRSEPRRGALFLAPLRRGDCDGTKRDPDRSHVRTGTGRVPTRGRSHRDKIIDKEHSCVRLPGKAVRGPVETSRIQSSNNRPMPSSR